MGRGEGEREGGYHKRKDMADGMMKGDTSPDITWVRKTRTNTAISAEEKGITKKKKRKKDEKVKKTGLYA